MQAAEGIWVFAYGSLMWRPDFEYDEACPARLAGWHRRMCILSNHYRGTAQRPGLVLGLDRGGSCRGRAFRVPAPAWDGVRDALHARELITGVYLPRFLPVRLDDGRLDDGRLDDGRLDDGLPVPAYAFVVDRSHVQYWRGSSDEAAALIRQGCGIAGTSRDYLASTVRHMEELGIGEGALHRLLARVDG